MSFEDEISTELVEKTEWATVASRFADYNFEQSPEYAFAMAARAGASTQFLIIRRAQRLVGAAATRIRTLPILGRGVAYVSGGPMTQRLQCDNREKNLKVVLAALKRELVEKQGHILVVRLPIGATVQEDTMRAFGELGFTASAHFRIYRTILVDLAPKADQLRRALAGKWRTDLNFAERCELDVENVAGEAAFERFLALFGEMRDTKNFDVNIDPNLVFELPPSEVGLEILIAKRDGRDAAGHIVSMLGNCAVYLFGATNELGRSSKAGYLLNWQAMLLAKQRGLRWYDLGGIDAKANPGGYRFKKRMGGHEVVAAGPFECRPSGFMASLVDRVVAVHQRLRG